MTKTAQAKGFVNQRFCDFQSRSLVGNQRSSFSLNAQFSRSGHHCRHNFPGGLCQSLCRIGTLTSLMIPYSVVFILIWTVFLVLFWLIGIPLGLQAGYVYPV
jgi:hypothetical protein